MTRYQVSVEADSYGDVYADTEALTAALNDAGVSLPRDAGGNPANNSADVAGEILADADKGMLMLRLILDAMDGVDAHSTGLEVWTQAWDAAFAEHGPPLRFAVTAVPLGDRAAVTA